jgi:hypothetical protein
MRNLLLALIAVLATNAVSGQTRIQLKLYQNTDFFNVSYQNSDTQETRETDVTNFDRISLAVAFSGNRNLSHEIEFFVPERSRSIYDVKFPMDYEFRESYRFTSEISTYSFRYELDKSFNPSNRVFFSLGVGINPYYTKSEYEPTMPNTYYRGVKIFGVSLNVVPRINFKITPRFLMEFNIPFKIYDLRDKESEIHNPAIPIRDQVMKDDLKHIFFESTYTLRLGIVYILKK